MQQSDLFTLAQLTDVHLGPLPPFWPRHWNVKRALGFINFWVKRRYFNDPTLIRELVKDLKKQTVDHIAVTGDLTNIGMPAEFIQSLEWLKEVGTPDDVTVIPGNHDIYTPLLSDPGVERWRPYMKAQDNETAVAGVPEPTSSGFPFVRRIGAFALININSAVPTRPGGCSGRIGKEQLERFAEMSGALHQAGFVRVVLIHHPPLPEHGTRRGLTDASAFEHVLNEAGAELVLHGHNHRAMISWRDTSTGPVPIVGAGAAGEGVYNLYHLERKPDGKCLIEVVVRAKSDIDGKFEERQRTMLDAAIDVRERII